MYSKRVICIIVNETPPLHVSVLHDLEAVYYFAIWTGSLGIIPYLFTERGTHPQTYGNDEYSTFLYLLMHSISPLSCSVLNACISIELLWSPQGP